MWRLSLLPLALVCHSALAQPGVGASIATVQGVRESGSLASLLLPDGTRYVVRGVGNPFRFAEVVYVANNPLFTLGIAQKLNVHALLDITVRGNLSGDVWNWQRNRWETKLIRYDIVGLSGGSRWAAGREFFGPSGDVRIRFRMRHSQDFRLRIDHLWVSASP